MTETLVDPLPVAVPADLSELVQQLRREGLELRQEVAGLQRENAELRQQAGYWKAMHARAVHRAEQREAELEQGRGENRTLRDPLFGRKSETASSQDRSNRLDGEEEPAPSTPPKRGPRQDRPGPNRRDYSHLPVVEDLRALPAEQRVCPQCGAALAPRGTEDSEPIEIEVRADRRRLRRRRYQRTCTCAHGPRTVTAAPAPALIPKGVLGVSVGVAILLDKCAGHRPTARLLSQGRRLGLDVAAGTVAVGLTRLEPVFRPPSEALLTRNAESTFAQADETRGRVFRALEGKSGDRWWLWVVVGQDTVAVRLDPTRSHEVPEGPFAAAARGVLRVDRDSASKARAQVQSGTVVLVFCWAHVRRDFVTVGKGWPEHTEWALAWLRRIRALYRHDRRRRRAPAEGTEFPAADADLRHTVAAMSAQADAELADAKLPTPCRKVLTSLVDHWDGLTRFLDDPRSPRDTHASERQARGPALGRQNYSGSGALWSGRLAAMLFSLFATLTLAKLNIRSRLTWFLESGAANGGHVPSDIDPFLPWKMSEDQRRAMSLDPDDSS